MYFRVFLTLEIVASWPGCFTSGERSLEGSCGITEEDHLPLSEIELVPLGRQARTDYAILGNSCFMARLLYLRGKIPRG
jgi:hypothetical protein